MRGYRAQLKDNRFLAESPFAAERERGAAFDRLWNLDDHGFFRHAEEPRCRYLSWRSVCQTICNVLRFVAFWVWCGWCGVVG